MHLSGKLRYTDVTTASEAWNRYQAGEPVLILTGSHAGSEYDRHDANTLRKQGFTALELRFGPHAMEIKL